MAKYAATTDVSVAKSRDEIEQTLARYGASSFGYMTAQDPTPAALIMFRYRERNYRISIPLPTRDDPALRQRASNQYGAAGQIKAGAWEQVTRQRWRAVALYVKATLEAIESGIVTFEDAFMIHALLSDGRTTVSEWANEHSDAIWAGQLPQLPGMPIRALPNGS